MAFFDSLPKEPEELAKLVEAIKRIELEKDAHYAAIGKVASNWAFFESTLNGETQNLGNIPGLPALCLMANILGMNKVDSYIALARALGASKKTIAALEEFKKDAKGLSEQRNRVVHDPWILISPREKAMRLELTARGKLRAELVTAPTGEVLKIAENINELTARFCRLARQVISETRGSSPETPPSTLGS